MAQVVQVVVAAAAELLSPALLPSALPLHVPSQFAPSPSAPSLLLARLSWSAKTTAGRRFSTQMALDMTASD